MTAAFHCFRSPLGRGSGENIPSADLSRCFGIQAGKRVNTDRAREKLSMQFESFSFGSIRIDGTTYEHDIVITGGKVRKRKKQASKKYRDAYGHTPVSIEEEIPWKCKRLVIGTGTGALPVMDKVKREAKRRKIELLIVPTARAIELPNKNTKPPTPSCT